MSDKSQRGYSRPEPATRLPDFLNTDLNFLNFEIFKNCSRDFTKFMKWPQNTTVHCGLFDKSERGYFLLEATRGLPDCLNTVLDFLNV